MNTNERIQTFGQFVGLCMMIATAWMAYETRQMSRYGHDMLAIESAPHLSLAGLPLVRIPTDPTSGVGVIQMKIQLKNPTRIPIFFRFTEVEYSLDDKIAPVPFTHQMSDILVGPGDIGHLLCYPIENIPNVMAPKQGKLFYKLKYWAKDKPPIEDAKNLMFIANNDNPDWLEMPLPTK